MTQYSDPCDGFRLAYDLVGDGPVVVLLHGWPGARQDYREVAPLLSGRARVVMPDLRGFGESDKHRLPPKEFYSQVAQVRSVLALLDELEIDRAVFGGYDVGSRIVHALARAAPDRVAGLVMTPPQPGAGARLLEPSVQQEFWYQTLHRLDLAEVLVDGDADAVRKYLAHFWNHWSGPDFRMSDDHFGRLVDNYSAPGAFVSSIAWYRSRPVPSASAAEEAPPAAERIHAPTEILWPTEDPLFAKEWSDRLDEWYSDVRLTILPGSGHFVPLEAPAHFADAVLRLLD